MDWFAAVIIGSMMGMFLSIFATIVGWRALRKPHMVMIAGAVCGVLAIMFVPLINGLFGISTLEASDSLTDTFFGSSEVAAPDAPPVQENVSAVEETVKEPEVISLPVEEDDLYSVTMYDTGETIP